MFNFFKKRAVGIDISDNTIELVELEKRGGNINILHCNSFALPAGIVERGRIKNEDRLAEKIKAIIKPADGKPINIDEIFFALPEALVYIHTFSISSSKLTKMEKEAFVLKEAQDNIPIKKEHLVIAYKVTKKTGKKTEFLIIGASKDVVLEWQMFFRKIKMELNGLDIEPLAVFRGLFVKNNEKSICIVDIGAVTTSIAIFDKNGLRYSNSLDCAGQSFTRVISEKLKIKKAEAEKQKIKFGISGKDKGAQYALSGEVEKIAAGIKEAIGIFEKLREGKVSKVILVGGSSKLEGLTLWLKDKLKMPVFLGKSVLMNRGKAGDEQYLYIGAIGAAMRGIDKKWDKKDPFLKIGELKNKKFKLYIYPRENKEDKKEQSKPPRRKIISIILVVGIIVAGFVFWQRNGVSPDGGFVPLKTDTEVRQPADTETKPLVRVLEIIPEAKIELIISDTPTNWLNVRSGPGTSYSKIGKVYPEEVYELLEEGEDWYKIKMPEAEKNKEGWISAQYAEIK